MAADERIAPMWSPSERLDVRGDRAVLDRYFTLVPPV
jgi:hypothetical protein